MNNIIIDTSSILAVVLAEPERLRLIKLTQNAVLIAPHSLHWEIGNAVSAMFKKKRLTFKQAKQIIGVYQHIPIQFVDVDLVKSIEVANIYDIYAYDAYMIVVAKMFQSPLLSLDAQLVQVAKQNKVSIVEV